MSACGEARAGRVLSDPAKSQAGSPWTRRWRPTSPGRGEQRNTVQRTPKDNRFEFVVIASARARQLLRGAEPRETGEKKVTIAQREVLRHKVEKLDDES